MPNYSEVSFKQQIEDRKNKLEIAENELTRAVNAIIITSALLIADKARELLVGKEVRFSIILSPLVAEAYKMKVNGVEAAAHAKDVLFEVYGEGEGGRKALKVTTGMKIEILQG